MTAYYNESDPEKAAWIRELIRKGMVAPGEVDERSITDVRADDLRGFRQCHFFAGIAVWSYALRLAGWPDDRQCWTGSCPCPSFSAAGKGEGFDDARHLWPAWWPLIRERRPATIFGEQVAAAIRHGWWDLVSTDLESETYAAAAAVLTSASVGGSDIRERLYWVADAKCNRRYDGRRESALCDASATGNQEAEWPSILSEAEGLCDALRLAESLHAERWPLSLDQADGRDGENGGRPEAHSEPGTCGEVFGLADATPRGRGMLRSAPREAGHTESSDEAGRMEHAEHGDDGHESGWFGAQPAGPARETGATGGMGDSDSHGCHQARRSECADGLHGAVGNDVILAEHFAADALKGFWGTADWLFCTDGRWRPVEAGTFPLDSGSAFRLGRLRGYGDAINAQAAKAFIEAYLETSHEQTTGVPGRWPR